jgi:hypothetical protein
MNTAKTMKKIHLLTSLLSVRDKNGGYFLLKESPHENSTGLSSCFELFFPLR